MNLHITLPVLPISLLVLGSCLLLCHLSTITYSHYQFKSFKIDLYCYTNFQILFCQSIPMFDIQEGGPGCARGEVLTRMKTPREVLVFAAEETSIHKVVKAAASVRDRQHGHETQPNPSEGIILAGREGKGGKMLFLLWKNWLKMLFL